MINRDAGGALGSTKKERTNLFENPFERLSVYDGNVQCDKDSVFDGDVDHLRKSGNVTVRHGNTHGTYSMRHGSEGDNRVFGENESRKTDCKSNFFDFMHPKVGVEHGRRSGNEMLGNYNTYSRCSGHNQGTIGNIHVCDKPNVSKADRFFFSILCIPTTMSIMSAEAVTR